MVHDLLFYEFLLGRLLWLGVQTSWRWRGSPATKRPPAQQPQRSPKTRTTFGGLTIRPYCAACEQGQEHGDPPPLSPPPVITAKRGRPRSVDTQTQYCPQNLGVYYGWVGRGHIRASGHPGRRT
jgi:hypothetical protein